MNKVYEIVDNQLVEVQVATRAGTPFDAVLDEYRGWREYTRLAEETKDTAYTAVAHEEFRHMLLMLSKALTAVNSMAKSEAERTELDAFFKAFHS